MKSRAWMIGILLILAVICSSALALVDIKIAPVIEKNNKIKYMKSVLDVFGIQYDPLNQNSIISSYQESIEEKEEEGLKIYQDKKSGQTAIECRGSGFQAKITLLVALKENTITGFKVIEQTETPGLGSRITEESFQKSFIGKKIDKGITFVKTGNAGETEFDAITGATETSKAIQRILNNGFRKYAELHPSALKFDDIKIAAVIDKDKQIKYMKIVLDFFGISYDQTNENSMISTYKKSVDEKDIEGFKIYTDKKSGQTAISFIGGGFQAPITLLVALKENKIAGFEVLDQTETPGLGARITEESFQKSFIGKKVDKGLTLVTTGKAGETEFDAITGATETSKALQRILNNGFKKYAELYPSALVIVDNGTVPSVEMNNRIKYMQSVLDVFGVPYDPMNPNSVISFYQETIVEKESEGLKIFSNKKSGQTAILCSGGGFKAQISLLVVLKENKIAGFKVLDQTETPGLRSSITDESYQKAFIGKKIDKGLKLVMSGKAGENEFDSITGATETSKAIQRILNNGFKKYAELYPSTLKIADNHTVPTAEMYNQIRFMEIVLDIFGDHYDPMNPNSVISFYQEIIIEKEIEGLKIFSDEKSGQKAIECTGDGFGAPITLLVALKKNRITGLKVLEQRETPGLGDQIKDESFQKSFIGKKVDKGITLVTKGKAGETEFDAITGATETSKAVQRILNNGIMKYFELVRKKGV